MAKEKFIINLEMQRKDGKQESFDVESFRIYTADTTSGALVVTAYPTGDSPIEEKVKKYIFPYGNYRKISYNLIDVKKAILYTFGGRLSSIKEWFSKHHIEQLQGGKWQFSVEVLGEKVVFVKGEDEVLDSIMESVLV